MDISTNTLTSYLKAFLLSTLLFIYILKLPNVLTNQEELVNEYYYSDNTVKMLVLDLVLIAIYFSVAVMISNYFEVKTLWKKVLITSITTFVISFSFYQYFLSIPLDNDSFFSRWFYKAGVNAVVYDVVFLTIVFLIFEKMKDNIL